MAKSRSKSKSTLATMKALSVIFFLAVAGLVLTGWELIGWALIPLALILGFTLPVMCKVVRTNGLACNHWAYSLLFGCGRVPGHRWKKFRARLQLPQREVKPVGRPRPAGSVALNYQPTRQRQEIKVTVEDGRFGVFGFWVSVVSMVAAVIPVIA